jgi:hypothetical protein
VLEREASEDERCLDDVARGLIGRGERFPRALEDVESAPTSSTSSIPTASPPGSASSSTNASLPADEPAVALSARLRAAPTATARERVHQTTGTSDRSVESQRGIELGAAATSDQGETRERDRRAPFSCVASSHRWLSGLAAIHVAATLGIADLLGGGARDSDDLASETQTHPPALYRLLRALAAVGVLGECHGRRFALTPVGDCLRSDAAEPVGGWAAFVGRRSHWHAWGELQHSVQTGENAFRHAHGVGASEYRAGQPEEAPAFDRAMADLARRSQRSIMDAYDFARFATVVDVGGGRGALLTVLLAAHPQMRGVLFDLPHVITSVDGISVEPGVAARCRTLAGSFFERVPARGDAYVLRAVLHDWDDADTVAILRNCRAAMRDDATLLIIERDLGPANELPGPKFSDLNMLVGVGGEERTIDEYAQLMRQAGLRFIADTPGAFDLHIIEAAPA